MLIAYVTLSLAAAIATTACAHHQLMKARVSGNAGAGYAAACAAG